MSFILTSFFHTYFLSLTSLSFIMDSESLMIASSTNEYAVWYRFILASVNKFSLTQLFKFSMCEWWKLQQVILRQQQIYSDDANRCRTS